MVKIFISLLVLVAFAESCTTDNTASSLQGFIFYSSVGFWLSFLKIYLKWNQNVWVNLIWWIWWKEILITRDDLKMNIKKRRKSLPIKPNNFIICFQFSIRAPDHFFHFVNHTFTLCKVYIRLLRRTLSPNKCHLH